MPDHGLGRVVVHDVRDFHFRMENVIPKRAPKNVSERYWDDNEFWGDQGQTPHCVGYGWTHWLTGGPIHHKPVPPIPPDDLYYECKDIDGEPRQEDGSSVRSGAQAVQNHGWIESYNWAYDAATVARAILTTGPVVVGTNWYEGMFDPDRYHRIHIGGQIAGGHCYVLNGYSKTLRQFRIKNSWGKSWGDGGHAYIALGSMDRLIREQGEACLAIERA